MSLFRITYKAVGSLFFIGLFFVLASLTNLFLFSSKFLRRKILTKISAFCSKIILRIIGFKVNLTGPIPENDGKMIIGNHMSYLDIVIYLSFFESVFVTSVETKQKPFLGQITQLAGCLFVERRNPRKLPDELKTIKKYFDNNISVCIFPEGTSSNGEAVLPFKKSLFQLPMETQCPIQPILLNYTSINGERFNTKNADFVCWHNGDEQPFFKHLFTMFALKEVKAELEVLPQIDSSKFQSRKEIADHCEVLLSTAYKKKKEIFLDLPM